MTTRMKFCGITRAEDARAAQACGADAIGLIFHPRSPRAVDVERARTVVAGLAPLMVRVAVFVDPEPAMVAAVLSCGIADVLQFHGAEPPEFCRGFGRRYLKAIRMEPGVDLTAQARRYADASALLVDTFAPDRHGGVGTTFDWNRLPPRLELPLVLAGGLTPANVREALAAVRPYAVDVASGVESAPGIKDHGLMALFAQAVRGADTQSN
ncbi:MAG: phosphoribosylanthranilate isomerase [Gammaproteobacteria bacterium]